MKKNVEYKIIIIDNDDASIELLNNTFNDYHCKIDNVDNEIDAADKIKLNDYDYYFISDYINGLNLINLIKEIKKQSKIIVMASDTSIEKEEKLRSFGITYLLKKPFSKKEVKELFKH